MIIEYDSPLLQKWPEQIYPPVGYTFPQHRAKVWKHKNGSIIHATPLSIPPMKRRNFVRFDFETPESRGMPCFPTKQSLVSDARWKKYFKKVYGELPSTYPICVSQLSLFYSSFAKSLNLSLPASQYDICDREDRRRSWSMSVLPSWTQYILHYDVPRPPLPHNTWVEVSHHSRSWKNGFERQGMWFSAAGGSGVWFNTGRTIAFRQHHDAFHFFQSHWETDLAVNARSAGYDTIQFTLGDSLSHKCCKKLGLQPNCFGLELMSTRLTGNYACGGKGASSALRSGWNAQRSCVCTEDNVDISRSGKPSGYINCVGTASHCASTPGCPPMRLPAARRAAWNRRASMARLRGRRL